MSATSDWTPEMTAPRTKRTYVVSFAPGAGAKEIEVVCDQIIVTDGPPVFRFLRDGEIVALAPFNRVRSVKEKADA